MQLACIHCGKPFTISREQLGGSGTCPHCHGQIQLPKAAEQSDSPDEPRPSKGNWWENSVSGLVSVVVHMALMLILALVQFSSSSGEGVGESVMIGSIPSETLNDSDEEELSDQTQVEDASEQESEEIELETPVFAAESEFADLAEPTPLSGGESSGLEVGSITIGGGDMAGGSWEGLMENLQRNGFDIVIVFDSTSSTYYLIDGLKRQIRQVVDTLLRLVPKARVSIVTYRDYGDEYVKKGIALTKDIQKIESFLREIDAEGGGDIPEAIHEGLKWAIENNQFGRKARKIILLFGDAPANDTRACLRYAKEFHEKGGVVSTVTCYHPRPLNDFQKIANVGGGEAFTLEDDRRLMTQLMTLAFGSRHRGKVEEAFNLMER